MRTSSFSVILLTLLAAVSLSAAPSPSPAPAAKVNLVADIGGFERSTVVDNLWDGVNSDNSLAGFNFSAQVVTERGSFSGLAMPPSVAFVDFNGDGKPDIVTADPTGFFRFYANSGTPTEPKFTSAEIIPIFVSTTNKLREWDHSHNDQTDEIRFCPRFALADWRHAGLLDLLVGNYYGEVLFLPNSGSARQPQFRWPGGIDRMRVQTNDQGRYWANLLSPVAYDWSGNGKLDLITGEGTYSANTIHLLENIGASDAPKFSSTRHTYIAYGDGREQLIPCVVDYNGDGNADLLVADRTGEVGVYLNTGKPKPGVELKRTSTLSFGSNSKLPGLCSITAGDYNGDGLFDLIIGLPNGHIALALNTGTKTEPKFGPIQNIKGEDRLKREVHTPDGWQTNTWNIYGNALSYFNVVNAQTDPESKPAEGTSCLKAGYWPPLGQTFPMPAEGIPGATKHFTVMRKGLTMEVNKKYHISFKAKGAAMEKLHWKCYSHYFGYPVVTKLEHGERGEAKHNGDLVDEYVDLGQDFSASGNWSTISGDVTPRYKSQGLAGEKTMPITFYIDFWASNTGAVVYLDDVQITEAQ